MNFYIMTLFPDMVMQGLNTSIIGRAAEKGLLTIEADKYPGTIRSINTKRWMIIHMAVVQEC